MTGQNTQPIDTTNPRLTDWVGRSRVLTDTIAPTPVRHLAASLDLDQVNTAPGTAILPGAHWLYFLEAAAASAIGDDGHAKLGGFLPPTTLPWRMWAGGRLQFHAPIRIGETLEKRSEVLSVAEKQGRSGPMVLVTVRHTLTDGTTLRLTEEHDIVYRGGKAGDTAPAKPAERKPEVSETRLPDPVLLFRYSALTFNGHRIHYDGDYCRSIGYPGLVVHGPLTATLLLLLASRRGGADKLRRFAFRAVAPMFAGHTMSVNAASSGPQLDLWACNHEGGVTMKAEAEFA